MIALIQGFRGQAEYVALHLDPQADSVERANSPRKKRLAYSPEYGQVLRRARSQLGQTQETVAKMADLSTEFYARLERGRALGSMETFKVLRHILGFDANELITALGARSVPVEQRLARTLATRGVLDFAGPYKFFALELYRARQRCQLTQETVASSIQCTEHFYQRIESAHTIPSVPVFALLHHRLEFDANRLLEAIDEDPPPTPRFYHVGAFIKKARRKTGETTAAVAQAAGCSRMDYVSIEAGTRLPTLAELTKMHGLLRFSGTSVLRLIRLCEDDR